MHAPCSTFWGYKHCSSYRLFRPAHQDSILVKQAVHVSVIKYLKREKWFLHPFVVANKVRNDPHPAKTATMSTAWVLCNAHGSYCMNRKGGTGEVGGATPFSVDTAAAMCSTQHPVVDPTHPPLSRQQLQQLRTILASFQGLPCFFLCFFALR